MRGLVTFQAKVGGENDEVTPSRPGLHRNGGSYSINGRKSSEDVYRVEMAQSAGLLLKQSLTKYAHVQCLRPQSNWPTPSQCRLSRQMTVNSRISKAVMDK